MWVDRFPYQKQLDASDCGAACLRMIAQHHGRRYGMDYLRGLSFVSKEGASMMSIAEAAEKIGFRTLGIRTGFRKLKDSIPLPCIAFWRGNHFVVIYRIAGDKVYIADPATGKLRLEEGDFLGNWATDVKDSEPQGILLLLEATPDFFRREEEQAPDESTLSILWSYVKQYRSLLLQLLLGLLIGSVIQLAFPFLMQALVDKGVMLRNLNFVQLILLAQVVLFMSQMIVEFLRGWILLHIGARVNISLMSDFLIKLMRLPMSFFDSRMTGDLLQRIYDNERIERFLTSSTLVTLFSVVNLLVFGTVLWLYHAPIFGVFALASGLYFGWVMLFMQRRRTLDNMRFEQLAENQSALIQLVNGMQEIKLHGAERQKRWNWERIQARLFRVNVQYLSADQWQRLGAAFVNEGKNILITIIAAQATINGDITLGAMLAIQYIVGHLNAPLESLTQFILAAQDARISLERMGEIRRSPEEEPPGPSKFKALPDDGSLSLHGVSFRYGGPSDSWVLQNLNLTIPQHRTTAIVGVSGSGKTTLLKLLLGFYPPTQGIIRLGDLSLGSFSLPVWRRQCGVVMQDGYIFSDTIARNIALGHEHPDHSQIIYAAKMANIHHFIETLPLGFNTKVGPDGIGLSQGQKQRLLIARAIYKRPEYLFFDEATNALDATNERIVVENLQTAFRNKTMVIVAHRLSTVRQADLIVVLHQGEIVEQGNHEQLVRLKGRYFQLIKDQLELGA
ncbi:MAG: peptidase domain-containing ABC transporter [Saprospiraceae bacterium]